MGYKDKEKASEWHKAHYAKYKETYRARGIKDREKLREFLLKLKSEPCVDCGGTFHPCAMDFHHIVEGKVRPIAEFRSITPKLLAELDKCVLLCANCHRVRHFVEGRDD